jgi:pimeloyl-ACP methyl ester carboxylesterase
MIVHTETVEQVIDRGRRGTFIKEVVRVPGSQPLGMVRKRLPPPAQPRGAAILVHGFGQNRYTWHVRGRSFSCDLAAHGWDVYNVELRGHGRSGGFGSARSSLLDEYIQEDLPAIAAEVQRLSGDPRPALIGHSMGGLVAYGAAATSLRGQLRGLITLGTPYQWALGSRTLAAVTALLTAFRMVGVFDRNPPVPLRPLGRHLRRRRSLWDVPAIPMPIRAWLPGSVEAEVLDEYLQRAFDVASAQVAFDIFRWGETAALQGRGGHPRDYGAAFELLDLPLLIIAGTGDHLAPPPSVRAAFERSHARDKSFHTFPLGHIDLIVSRRAPLTVWPLVERWLDQH